MPLHKHRVGWGRGSPQQPLCWACCHPSGACSHCKLQARRLFFDLEQALENLSPDELNLAFAMHQHLACADKLAGAQPPLWQPDQQSHMQQEAFQYVLAASAADRTWWWRQKPLLQKPLVVIAGTQAWPGWLRSIASASSTARIYVFEGVQGSASLAIEFLCSHTDSDAWVTVYPVGLSHSNSTCKALATGAMGLSPVLHCADQEGTGGAAAASVATGAEPAQRQPGDRVLVRRLDDLVQEPIQLLSLDASISGFDVLQGATRMLQKHWVKYLMLRGHLNQSSLELLISYGCSISTGGFSGPFLSSKQLRTADSSMFYVSCGT